MRDYADVTILLDRSGSMEGLKAGTVEGVNAFIAGQKAVPGEGCWSLYQFDTPQNAGSYISGVHSCQPGCFPECVFCARDQREVQPLRMDQFVPRGGTALYDAACLLIDLTGRRLSALPEHLRPNKVVFVIMTDGIENSSTTFTHGDMAQRIAVQRERYNWKFVFLGANQDAVAEAASYNIPAGSAFTYQATNAGSSGAYGMVSAGLRSFKLDGNNTAKELLIEPVVPAGCVLPGANVNN